MIYQTRKEIKIIKNDNNYYLILETPLNILKVNKKIIDLINICYRPTSIYEISSQLMLEEEEVFKICNFLNQRSFLEIYQPKDNNFFPFVSVIIPVKDRQEELDQCLEALCSIDFPKEKLEIIIIDDGSKNKVNIKKLNEGTKYLFLRNPKCLGQSYSRNWGAKNANGEILAFIDSDCIPGDKWLKDLVQYFKWDRIGAVGGFVDGYYNRSFLERYEKVFSPLNMGSYINFGLSDNSTFYIPTCNFLIRKQLFNELSGFNELLHVGEDVDICWRLRKKGHYILYVPYGIVKHLHRSQFSKMVKRRFEYGTSEAILYKLHPEKTKKFHYSLFAALNSLFLLISILFKTCIPIMVIFLSFIFELILKKTKIKKIDGSICVYKIFLSIIRYNFSFFYTVSFHFIRYYLFFFVLFGFFYKNIWFLVLLMFFVSSYIEYKIKRPILLFPFFLFFFISEQLFYQLGVLYGAIKERKISIYFIKFIKNKKLC